MPKISYGPVDPEPSSNCRPSPKRAAKLGVAAVGLAGVIGGATTVFAAPAAHAGGMSKDQTNKVFIKHKSKGCTVYLNDPRHKPNKKDTIYIPKGQAVVWRGSPDAAGKWAIVQDQKRSKKQFDENGKRLKREEPWWGYAQRDCLGPSVKKQEHNPAGVLPPTQGNVARNHHFKDRKYDPKGAAPLIPWKPNHLVKQVPKGPGVINNVRVNQPSTLRGPQDIVVGNVPKDKKLVVLPGQTDRGKNWVKACYATSRTCGNIKINQLDLKKLPKDKRAMLRALAR